ncbi:hypothetical protein RHS01_03658 [Rhizoctonia solani]|uniref:DUF6532 domain-containing protein n=1 Tax=Rhizoctonia solani TaxID=456999 RepID=A0A8H7IG16_9AGAM|nr:hypothetical protein RHS01_03658 [Rhizoctonia solani]
MKGGFLVQVRHNRSRERDLAGLKGLWTGTVASTADLSQFTTISAIATYCYFQLDDGFGVEAEPQLRRSERTKTPSQKGELGFHEKPADCRENFERKKTVKKKRAAAAMDAPCRPAHGHRRPRRGFRARHLNEEKRPQPVTPAAVLSKSSRRLLTPIEEDDKGPYAQFDHPGPRPKPTNDPINDGVVLEEWQRQRLLWFLVQRDGRPIDPDSDYDEMKKLLGPDGNWHSEDETQDASIFVGRLFGAPANTRIHEEEIGRYNDEPSPRKPVPVKALATPPAKSAPPPGNKTQKSNTATNLFKPKPPNGPHNLSQSENLPQRASQSTGERLKPCIIRASKLVIQQPNSHAPEVALGSFAAAQARPVTTTGQPVCPSEFPPLQAQPSYPSEPWGQLGAPLPLTAIPTCPWPLGSHSYQRPPPPNWAPSQAPPPGRNHFDHNTGPQDLPAQVPPPIKHLHLIAPRDLLSRMASFSSAGTAIRPNISTRPVPSSAKAQRNAGGSGRASKAELPANSSPTPPQHNQQHIAKQKRSKRGASGNQHVGGGNGHTSRQSQGNEAPAQDEDEGGMEGDEDEPIGTHKSGSRGRLKDFHGPEKHVLQRAGRLFIAIMASRGMYETDIEIIDQRRLEAWTAACEGIKVDPNDYPIAPAHVENLDDRLCVWPQFGARDRVFPAPAPSNLPEQNLFKFKKDIGPQFPQYFKKVTRELICFSCAIEWDTGVRVRSNLDFETQQKAYNTHLESQRCFWYLYESTGAFLLTTLQSKHSSASKSAIPLDNKNVLRREDVRSDAPSEQELAAWREEQATMDNTQQIGVDQGFKQDGEDWAEQDRLPSHGGSADNTPKRQNSHYNHNNCGYEPEHSRSHQRSDDRDHVQTRERRETRNGHSERSPPRQDNNQSTTQTKTHVKAQTLILSAAAIAKDLAITAIVNIHRTGMTSWGTRNSSQTTIIVITDFDNRNEHQGQGGWDYRLQSGPQRSNYNHHDSHLLQDNCHGREDKNAVPRVDHSLSGGARNTHNQREYPQGGSFNDGGYYQHQGTSQSRNPPNNHP